MKSFTEFRRTSARLYEALTTSMPAERQMASDLEDPTAIPMDEDEEEIDEDAPANNVGGGAIAGVGVGAHGEPGVPVSYKRKKRTAVIVGPPASDPRMFQAKIFSRSNPKV